LAHDDSGANHVDIDPVRTVDNEMILEAVFGIFLTVVGGGDKSIDPASVILKGINGANKVIEKKKKKELDASLEEELNQMTKDYIYKLGG